MAWAVKVKNFFTDEGEGEQAEGQVVSRVANSIVMMSFGREEIGDHYVSPTPNWKLRLFNVIVGVIQLFTGKPLTILMFFFEFIIEFVQIRSNCDLKSINT
jgi:hypothetical protein